MRGLGRFAFLRDTWAGSHNRFSSRLATIKTSSPGYARSAVVATDCLFGWIALFAIVVLIVSGYLVMSVSAYLVLSDQLSASYFLSPFGFLAGFVSVGAVSIVLDGEISLAALGALVILLILAPIGIVSASVATFATFGSTLGAPLGGILAYLLLRKRGLETKMAITWLTMIFVIWVLFVAVTWQPAMGFAMNEPTGKGWAFDPYASLKMFYLMKRGVGYYEAYFVSVALNAGLKSSQVLAFQGSSFFSWRGPLLFYIWMLLPNGAYLYGAYVFLSSVAIVCGYLAFSKKFSKRMGLLAATVLVPYFTLGLGGSWWIEWEFWGSIFSIFAFTAYFRGHRIVAVLPAFLAAACKDTLAGALVGGFIGCAFRRDKQGTLVWGAGIAGYAIYTLWNYLILRQYLGVSMNVSRWVGQGGSGFVAETFQFTTPWLWGGWTWVLIVISLYGIITIRPIHLSIFAAATTLAPIIVFLLIGQTWDVYWGVVYVPFVLLMVAYTTGCTCRCRPAQRTTITEQSRKT